MFPFSINKLIFIGSNLNKPPPTKKKSSKEKTVKTAARRPFKVPRQLAQADLLPSEAEQEDPDFGEVRIGADAPIFEPRPRFPSSIQVYEREIPPTRSVLETERQGEKRTREELREPKAAPKKKQTTVPTQSPIFDKPMTEEMNEFPTEGYDFFGPEDNLQSPTEEELFWRRREETPFRPSVDSPFDDRDDLQRMLDGDEPRTPLGDFNWDDVEELGNFQPSIIQEKEITQNIPVLTPTLTPSVSTLLGPQQTIPTELPLRGPSLIESTTAPTQASDIAIQEIGSEVPLSLPTIANQELIDKFTPIIKNCQQVLSMLHDKTRRPKFMQRLEEGLNYQELFKIKSTDVNFQFRTSLRFESSYYQLMSTYWILSPIQTRFRSLTQKAFESIRLIIFKEDPILETLEEESFRRIRSILTEFNEKVPKKERDELIILLPNIDIHLVCFLGDQVRLTRLVDQMGERSRKDLRNYITLMDYVLRCTKSITPPKYTATFIRRDDLITSNMTQVGKKFFDQINNDSIGTIPPLAYQLFVASFLLRPKLFPDTTTYPHLTNAYPLIFEVQRDSSFEELMKTRKRLNLEEVPIIKQRISNESTQQNKLKQSLGTKNVFITATEYKLKGEEMLSRRGTGGNARPPTDAQITLNRQMISDFLSQGRAETIQQQEEQHQQRQGQLPEQRVVTQPDDTMQSDKQGKFTQVPTLLLRTNYPFFGEFPQQISIRDGSITHLIQMDEIVAFPYGSIPFIVRTYPRKMNDGNDGTPN